MKKYFCKFLPVEGEIKSQIWQWYNNATNTGWELISCSDMDAIIAHGLQPTPKFRRVKLFLCSRDIHLDDKFISQSSGKEHTCHSIQERNFYWKNVESETGYSCDDGFKIIGEVSPEAIFVKEGDEFDEEDLLFDYNHIKFRGKDFRNGRIIPEDRWEKGEKEKYKLIIEINCPTCKNFH